MRVSLLLLPLAALGLVGCVDVHSHPPAQETVVTPAPAPAPVYTAPGTYAAPGSTSTTVVTRP